MNLVLHISKDGSEHDIHILKLGNYDRKAFDPYARIFISANNNNATLLALMKIRACGSKAFR